MIKNDQTCQIRKMHIIYKNWAVTPSQSIDLATWSAEPFQPWVSIAAMAWWSCFSFLQKLSHVTRLPCTDLCRSLVGNAKRATLSNKGTCHNMFRKYVSSPNRSFAICAWLDLGNFIAMCQDHRCIASYQQVPCQGERLPSWPGQPRMTQEFSPRHEI